MRKIVLSVVLAAILAIQSVSLGWSIAEIDRKSIAVYALHVAFALYSLVVAVRSVKQEYSLHAQSVVHLSVLTTVAVSFSGVTTILPSSPIPVTRLAAASSVVPLALWYVVFALYVVAWAIAITTPRGPRLHYPSDRIYSQKTLMQVTSKYEDNVSGVTGASVLDIMLFSYSTKVVMLGYTSESLEIGDLPIVPADMRATHIFATMKAALGRWTLRIRSWRPSPGSGWETGWRIFRVNTQALIMLVVLVSMSAGLYYVPAFFLQRLVAYLEQDPERRDRSWGWVFCAGLFFSNIMLLLGMCSSSCRDALHSSAMQSADSSGL